MKKFRFQLLHAWIVEHLSPCRVADIGGGKGLLAFLLDASGFDATVVDPLPQPLPTKYKDLAGTRHLIPAGTGIRRVTEAFEVPMARRYDLLVGLHAHGSNMKILEAAARHGTGFILLPCCVIDEPIEIRPNVDWFESLAAHAGELGLGAERFELNFRGQCHGFFSPGAAPAERPANRFFAYTRGTGTMETITCPFCRHACKPEALLCPSCGLSFQRWMEAHPGQVIEGWAPPKGSLERPAAPPPVPAPEAPPTGKEGKKELDARAKALIELYKTEAAFRTNPDDARIASSRATMLLMVLAIIDIVFGLSLATVDVKGVGNAIGAAFFAAAFCVMLSIGVFQGRRSWLLAALVLGGIDLLFDLPVFKHMGPGLRNTAGLKVIVLGYLGKLAHDMR